MKPVQIDGGEDVCDLRSGNVELGEQFNLATRNPRINLKFSRDRDEIFLQHLQRQDSGPVAPMFRYKIEGASLLRGCSLVIRIDKHIGIEEATSAHESRLG